MDALLLSRVQFALTTVYHFLFVPVTLGLSIFVALLETGSLFAKTYAMRDRLRKLAKFFGGLFLINFAMGVVTGIVQEFHFGMNWSEYSRFMGDIFGAPLALEALTAFFLESTFLGLWIFGWERLSPKLHCLTIWIVALGSNLSAFWILTANSFMQHPVGYAIRNGRAEMTDFAALVTNPYIHGEFGHALLAGVTTAGFLVLAVSAWKLLNDRESRQAFEMSLKAAVVYTMVGLLGVMGVGHFHTQYLAQANPMKLSAMEALWETENPAPFTVMAVINEEEHKNDAAIEIPALFSFMLYNRPEGEVKGMNDLQQELVAKYGEGNYYPDVTGLFFSFRIMIAAGGLMMAMTALLGFLAWRKKLLDFPIVLKAVQLLVVLPFIANTVGWYIAEAGRQPWIVVGLQKTASAVSPNLTAGEVGLTIAGFTAVYLVLIAVAVGIGFRHVYNTRIADEQH